MAVGSATLKALQTSLYGLAFGCSAVILCMTIVMSKESANRNTALYSYLLAIQTQQGVAIPNKQRAVEGIGGSAVLYTILATLFTCFIGGIPFFAFLGIGTSHIGFEIVYQPLQCSMCSSPPASSPSRP
jgi:hypothetical protein